MENEYYEYHVRKIIKEHRIFENAEFTFDTSKCYDVIKSMDKYSMNTFEKDGTYDFTDMLYITLKKLQEGKWKVPGWYLFSNICVVATSISDITFFAIICIDFSLNSAGLRVDIIIVAMIPRMVITRIASAMVKPNLKIFFIKNFLYTNQIPHLV